MSEFLTYSLRTGACIAVFYLFFKLLLSRETFHAFNRALVLAATAVSFVLPLCVITVQRTLPARETVSTSDEYPYPAYADIVMPAADTPTDAPAGGSLSAARVMAASATPLPEETVAPESEETVAPEPEGMVSPLTEEDILSDHASAESVAAVQPSVSEAVETSRGVEIPWRQIGIVIYLAGVAAVIFVTVRSIVGLHRLMRRGRCERLDDGTTLVRMDENVAPISWCRNIVISERDLRENGAAILAHERAHVRLHHSLDLLLVDLAGAVQWFNPAMWLLRRDLRAIHEYEADAAVIASGVDARSYQLLLIRKAVGGRWYSIANSFNHSKLKNRITMMLREKSSRRTRARALLLLPLAGLALGAFAETVYVRPEDKVTKEFLENQLSETQIVSDMESAAGSRIGMPRGAGDDAGVVAGDTVRRGEMPKTRNWDSLSEQERERIRKYFESDEWKAKAEELEKMGEYFESDEWKQAKKELEKLGEYFESDEWKRKAEAMDEAGRKLEEYINGGEWRQKQQELEKLGEYFESDEWKQAVKKMTEQGAKMEEYFNNDEWKQKAKELEEYFNSGEWRQKQQELAETAAEMKAYFESDDWRHTQQLMSEAAAKMEEYFNSDEWKQQQQELEKLDEYFESDEWREAWKHAEQATRSGDDDYFQSDEWREVKRKLEEWRAAHDESGMPEWVIEARRDMERNRETLRQDMAETQQRIMETQRQIAETQEKIQQSGDNDRRVKREMKKTHREMEKVYKEMLQAQEEMKEAQEEIEQAAREIGQENK